MATNKHIKRQGSIETERAPDLYFRVIPQSISFKTKAQQEQPRRYVIYLQKGMQVFGKSTHILHTSNTNIIKLPSSKNYFDFQINQDKNLTYSWTLYQVDSQQLQQRLQIKQFSVRQAYNNYSKDRNQIHSIMNVTFDRNGANIKFMLFIHNTSDYIVKLTAILIPEVMKQQVEEIVAINKTASKQNKLGSSLLELKNGSKSQKKQKDQKKSSESSSYMKQSTEQNKKYEINQVKQVKYQKQVKQIQQEVKELSQPEQQLTTTKIADHNQQLISIPQLSQTPQIIQQPAQIQQMPQKIQISQNQQQINQTDHNNNNNQQEQILRIDSKPYHNQDEEQNMFDKLLNLKDNDEKQQQLVVGDTIDLGNGGYTSSVDVGKNQPVPKQKNTKFIVVIVAILLLLIGGLIHIFDTSTSQDDPPKPRSRKQSKKKPRTKRN